MKKLIFLLLVCGAIFAQNSAIAIEDTSIFSESSEDSEIVFNLEVGDTVNIVSSGETWLLVRPKNKVDMGYVYKYKVMLLTNEYYKPKEEKTIKIDTQELSSSNNSMVMNTPVHSQSMNVMPEYKVITIQEYPHLKSYSTVNLVCQLLSILVIATDNDIKNKEILSASLSVLGGTIQTAGLISVRERKVLAPL